jgi:C_GCAxxG_C_C family probable redox protein
MKRASAESAMSAVDAAVHLFRSGCACSQAVLGAYGPRYGLDESQGIRVAAGFAGGMRRGDTCGAVTGAFMVFGLAHCGGACRTADGRQAVYGAVTSFAETFRGRHGSLACRDLLGCDIGTPEGLKHVQETNLHATVCGGLVESAAGIIEQLLADKK